MSILISAKIKDEILKNTDEILKDLKKSKKISRNAYINEALDEYNRLKKREILKKQFERESKIVAKESLKILAEFEALPDTYEF